MEDSVLQTLAKQAELPRQVQECLLASGYNTISAISSIGDIKVIESFFQRKHALFTSADQRNTLYGIYTSAPDQFEFLPGHVELLKIFIQNCKNAVEKQASIERNATARPKAKIPKLFYRNTPILRNVCASSMEPSSMTFSRVNEDSPISKYSAINPSDMQESQSEEHLEQDVLLEIKRRLSSWSQKHESSEVQQLKCDTHYKILGQRKCTDIQISTVKKYDLAEDDGKSSSMLELYTKIQPFMKCLMCKGSVLLSFNGKNIFISNATRHLLRCLRIKDAHKKRKASESLNDSKVSDDTNENLPSVNTLKNEQLFPNACEIVQIVYETETESSADICHFSNFDGSTSGDAVITPVIPTTDDHAYV